MPDTGGRPPLTTKQKWKAIVYATLVLMASYWAIVFAFILSEVEDGPSPGPPLALGLALVPFVFVVLSMVSQHADWPGATLKAMGVAAVFGVLVSAFAADAVSGLVAGFGAGGILALRAGDHHRWTGRALAVAGVTVYVMIVLRVVSVAGLVFGPLLPLPALAVADAFMDYRAAKEHPTPEAA